MGKTEYRRLSRFYRRKDVMNSPELVAGDLALQGSCLAFNRVIGRPEKRILDQLDHGFDPELARKLLTTTLDAVSWPDKYSLTGAESAFDRYWHGVGDGFEGFSLSDVSDTGR